MYIAEYYDTLDVRGIERAIATSVATALNSCDDESQPQYAVEISEESAHQVIATGE